MQTTTIEVLTKGDLLQFKKDLIEEMSRLFSEKSTPKEIEFLKSKEVKRILKCSDSTLQYYRDSGRLSHKKVGSTYFYTKDDIDKLMNSSNVSQYETMINFEPQRAKSSILNNNNKKSNYE